MGADRVRAVDEDRWLAAAAEGDQEAFGELVRRYQEEVYALALRIVPDRDLAADVTQDAFVRAWRALPRFRGEARFSTWLYRITVNTAFTHRARRRRDRSVSLEGMPVEPEAEGLTPERAGESVAARRDLERALAELRPSARVVVVLKDVYGWSHAEIAEELGISVTAAKVRLHRARRRLRRLLWPHRGYRG